MGDPLLTVQNLSVGFRKRKATFRAVDQLSLTLHKGETLAVVGESGCGKSVTALAILQLIPNPPGQIETGEIQYGGRNLLALSSREMRSIRGKEIAMIFQEPMTSLNPVFTVGDQISEAIQIHQKESKTRAREKAIQAMERVGIPAAKERYSSYPHEMSGGMRQRVMIAMALSCHPAVLIADEPTTALDVTIQSQILELIATLQTDSEMGVILITHDLGVVAEVADRVLVMYAGVVVESATVEVLFANPLHPYTQALYRSLPSKSDEASSGRLEVIPGRVPSLEDIPSYCRFFDRCSQASEECKADHPPLREVEVGHFVRCVKV